MELPATPGYGSSLGVPDGRAGEDTHWDTDTEEPCRHKEKEKESLRFPTARRNLGHRAEGIQLEGKDGPRVSLSVASSVESEDARLRQECGELMITSRRDAPMPAPETNARLSV